MPVPLANSSKNVTSKASVNDAAQERPPGQSGSRSGTGPSGSYLASSLGAERYVSGQTREVERGVILR